MRWDHYKFQDKQTEYNLHNAGLTRKIGGEEYKMADVTSMP